MQRLRQGIITWLHRTCLEGEQRGWAEGLHVMHLARAAAAVMSTTSVATTLSLWKRMVAGLAYPRLSTTSMAGSANRAAYDRAHSNHAKRGG